VLTNRLQKLPNLAKPIAQESYVQRTLMERLFMLQSRPEGGHRISKRTKVPHSIWSAPGKNRLCVGYRLLKQDNPLENLKLRPRPYITQPGSGHRLVHRPTGQQPIVRHPLLA
jgi:hypothetical protein